MNDDIEFDDWVRTVPPDITTDTIWRTPAYRLSLYVYWCAQSDVQYFIRDRARAHVDQLLRAVGGISASLDEGYSRMSGRERAHYYEYSLGSAREARSWYYKMSAALPAERFARRLSVLSRIVRILTAIIPRERNAEYLNSRQRTKPVDDAVPDNPAARSSS